MNSRWRALVASSVVLMLLFHPCASHAQSSLTPNQKRFTISLHHATLEDALDELSEKTAIDFVYSASTLEMDRLFSFSAVDKPIETILDNLGQQLNISFTRLGDHIVVKKILTLQVIPSESTQPSDESKTQEPIYNVRSSEPFDSASDKMSSAQPYNFLTNKESISSRPLSIDQRIKVRTTLDSLILSSLSRGSFTSPGERSSRWFALAAIFANDYTYNGLEFQAGTRALFGILNISNSNNKLTRIGYGIGTTISTYSSHWNFSLAYTLAKIQKKNDFVINRYPYYIALYNDVIKLNSTQHQIKFIASYPVSKQLFIQFGPTLNVLNTRYQFMDKEIPVASEFYFISPEDHFKVNLSAYMRSSNTIIPPYSIFSYYSLDRYVNTKLWIGLEASLSYRINFQRK